MPDLDLSKISFDNLYRQSLSDDPTSAHVAWRTLGSLSTDRPEAGVFLLGLIQLHKDDLARMAILVEAISRYPSPATAETLQSEFLRVPSTPSTRTYLNEVFRALERLPPEVGGAALKNLAADKRVSLKWQRKFEAAVDQARGW